MVPIYVDLCVCIHIYFFFFIYNSLLYWKQTRKDKFHNNIFSLLLNPSVQSCDCDQNDHREREDEGNVTDSDYFPISQLRFGDTGHSSENSTVTLGPLRCHTGTDSRVICL